MADIASLDLESKIQKVNPQVFIETGCHHGAAISWILENFPSVQRIFSCDISDEYVDFCNRRFKQERASIHLSCLDSLSFLKEVLPEQGVVTFFWLDAHYPFLYDKRVKDDKEISIKFPLLEECKLISRLKKHVEKDLIVCDDIRVIKDKNNPRWKESENLEEKYIITDFVLQDIIKLFSDTHDVDIRVSFEGYLVFYPKYLGK